MEQVSNGYDHFLTYRYDQPKLTTSNQSNPNFVNHPIPSRTIIIIIFPVLVSIQNDAGYAKWGPDAERVKKLVNAFRPTPRERHHSNGES
jgi:hypothetical protein